MECEPCAIYGRFLGSPFAAEVLFRDLAPAALRSLAEIADTIEFPQDAYIIVKGSRSGIYILAEGEARIEVFNPLNNSDIAQNLEVNAIFGLVETIAKAQFEFSVKALTNCLFQYIARKEFIAFLYDRPDLCFQLAKSLGRDLNDKYRIFSSATF